MKRRALETYKRKSIGCSCQFEARLVALLPFLQPQPPLSLLFLSHTQPLDTTRNQNNDNKKRSFKTLEGGTPQFEVREYAPATWSTTSFPAGTSWDEVRSKGFDRNFNYIKGAGVAMTAPVLTRLSGDGSFGVSFLVPAKYGTSPPAPKPDSGVKIEESPVRRVVVRSWVGTYPKFESQGDVDAAFAALMADADRAGLIVGAPPKDGGIQGWTAGYDSPMTDPSKRRHEVWLPLVARKSEVAPAERGGGAKAAVAAASAQP